MQSTDRTKNGVQLSILRSFRRVRRISLEYFAFSSMKIEEHALNLANLDTVDYPSFSTIDCR